MQRRAGGAYGSVDMGEWTGGQEEANPELADRAATRLGSISVIGTSLRPREVEM